MKDLHRLLLLLATVAPAPFGAARAEAPATAVAPHWSFAGSVRVRLETIDNQPRAGVNASDSIINLRTRLRADYKTGATSFVGELFDSRIEGEDAHSPVSTNEVDALELVQAYVETKRTVGDVAVTGRLGRFLLNMGSRRLVAADDYRNTTSGYTGAKLDLKRGPLTGEFIYVLPQRRLPDDLPSVRRAKVEFDQENSAAQLYGGIATWDLKALQLQGTAIGFRERDQSDLPTRDRRLTTLGIRAFRLPKASGGWDFDVEGYRQTGDISASIAPGAAQLDVDAGYIHATLRRTFPVAWAPRLALEYDRAEGDAPGGRYTRFDTLFGMRRSELGPAGLYNDIGRANIDTLGVRLEVQPSARLDAFVAVKDLRLDDATDSFSTSGVRDPSGKAGREAGVQVDSRLRYWVAPQKFRVELNALYLDQGSFFARAPNANRRGDTTYVALDLSRFF